MAVTLQDFCLGDGTIDIAGLYWPCVVSMAFQWNRQDVVRSLLQRPGDPEPIVLWNWDETEEFWKFEEFEWPQQAVLRQGNRWIINLRGTVNAGQWRQHITGVPGLEYELPGFALAHGFHLRMERDLTPFLDAKLPSDKSTIERLYIVGHSYGAAVAQLMSNRFREMYPDLSVHVCTFGGPRTCTNGYEGRQAQCFVRVVREGDLVPQVPAGSITVISLAGPFNKVIGWVSRGAVLGKYVSAVVERYLPRAWMHYGKGMYLWKNGQGFEQQSGNFTSDDFSPAFSPGWRYGHLLDTGYWPSMRVWYDRNLTLRPGLKEVIDLGDAVVNDDIPPEKPVPLPAFPPSYDEQLRAALGFAPNTGPTIVDVWRGTSAFLTTTVSDSRKAGNKFESQGGDAMASGKWKGIWKMSQSEFSRSEYLVCATSTRAGAKAVFDKILQAYVLTMGSDKPTQQIGVDAPTVGGGIIQTLVIRDALNGKDSLPYEIPGSTGEPYSIAEGNKPADNPFYGIRVTLRAKATVNGEDHFLTRPFTFHMFPDACVDGGRYVGTTISVRTSPSLLWHKAARDVLLAVTLPANNLGMMGQDPAVPGYDCFNWAVGTNGNATALVPDANWVDGDRIKITKAEGTQLSGTYKVLGDGAGTWQFIGLRRLAADLPTTAVGTRVRRADGTWEKIFFQFERPDDDFASASYFKVCDRKAARRVPLCHSTRRRKRSTR